VRISRTDRLEVFDKAWEAVNKHFYDPKFNGVDWPQMKKKYRPLAEAAADKIELQGVIRTMFGELHTSHLSVDNGIWYGSGLSYIRYGEQYVVRRAYPGSPAQLAGIEQGWILRGAQGNCDGWNQKMMITFVDIGKRDRTFDLACGVIPRNADDRPPAARMLDDAVAYVRFSLFSGSTASWFADQVAMRHSASVMVIDMRDNGGGDIDAVLSCLNHFFAGKTVVGKARTRNGSEWKWQTKGAGSKAYGGQVVVLIDERSVSGAEVFAAAMQETGRGIVVGRRTSGNVLAAGSHKLPNGFKVNVAHSDFHTAKGVRLEGRGVTPDKPVDLQIKDVQEGRDPDLDRVRELLVSLR
jgi:carboxyl-terminal processing protease